MNSIDQEEDEQMYRDTTVTVRRHLTDEVLRVPLEHLALPEVVFVAPDAFLQDVIVTMREQRQNAVLVTDPESGRMLGIFTERDLLLRVAGRGWNFYAHKIHEVMTPNPECVTPKHTAGFALNKMMVQGYRHLPIVNEDGRAYGMVGARDLLKYLVEHFPEDVMNQPPDVKPPANRDGG